MDATTIPAKVANSRTVTRFKGAPHAFALSHYALAMRSTYTTVQSGWDVLYTYKLHADRCAAHKYANSKDNSVRLVVQSET